MSESQVELVNNHKYKWDLLSVCKMLRIFVLLTSIRMSTTLNYIKQLNFE